jgi:Fur family peroxide stress response transcriptional regulator
MQTAANHFRELCQRHGIAVTHQRQVVFEAMQAMHGHPTPEEVYLLVKERVPAISLATVYKNIHLFIDSGLFREVSMHHGTLRVETNHRPHHHLLCSECKSISDIDEATLGLLPPHTTLPGGFLVERFSVDVIGLCAECQTSQTVN